MTEIDNKKMWEALIQHRSNGKIMAVVVANIVTALNKQGLTVNDNGEIVGIEPEWYVALEDYGSYQNTILGKVPLFLKGERTTKENVFSMCSDIMCYTITEEEFNKHFRPATKEDISEAEYQKQDKGIENALRESYKEIEEEPEQKCEDEKIRKEILDYIIKGSKSCYDVQQYGKERFEKWIAWLEKQGEQKPTDKVEPKFKVGDKIYLKPEYRMPDDDTPIANTVFEIRVIDDKHYRFDSSYIFIEDQDKYELVGQKPAETTDFRTWKYIVDAVLTEREGIGQYIDSPWTTEVAEKLQKRFGSIEQKPAWSEEDESMRTRCIGILGKCYIGELPTKVEEELNWLKSLKYRVQPQPKQEWSEEDEHRREDAIYFLETAKKHYASTSEIELTIDWLKSLCPQKQWKPSIEQLKSLKEVIDVGHFTSYPNALETLYEQLKKLMEEQL